MEKQGRTIVSIVLVVLIAYCLLGVVGMLPAQYDATKGFKAEVSYASLERHEITTDDSRPAFMQVDGSGNVWFTEAQGEKVGKLTPDGTLYEYTIPAKYRLVNKSVASIYSFGCEIVGNDLYVVSLYGFAIAKLDMNTGVFNEYPLPLSKNGGWVFCGLLDSDSDGNIWTANLNYSSIFKFNTKTNIFTEYVFDSTGKNIPCDVVVDSSDDVFFTVREDNGIGDLGKMDKNGNFDKYYDLPVADAFRVCEMELYDDMIWIACGDRIIKFNTITDAMTSYVIPKYYGSGSLSMQFIGVAEDYVWFTNPYFEDIGRMNKLTGMFDISTFWKPNTESNRTIPVPVNYYPSYGDIIATTDKVYVCEWMGNSVDSVWIADIEIPESSPLSIPKTHSVEDTPIDIINTFAQASADGENHNVPLSNAEPAPAPLLNTSQIIFIVAIVVMVIVGVYINYTPKKGGWRRD